MFCDICDTYTFTHLTAKIFLNASWPLADLQQEELLHSYIHCYMNPLAVELQFTPETLSSENK